MEIGLSPRKGITPVIAIVMLLMMTVAAAGGAYVWITKIQSQIQRRTTRNFKISVTLDSVTCYPSADKAEFLILNNGKASINADSAIVEVRKAGDLIERKTTNAFNNAGFESPLESGRNNVSLSTTDLKKGEDYQFTVKLPNTQSYTLSGSCYIPS